MTPSDKQVLTALTQEVALARAEVTEVKSQTAEIIGFWNSAKDGLKVLGWLGRIARWVTRISLAIAAVSGAVYAIRHWGEAPNIEHLKGLTGSSK